ncbi:MAG TPA: hypothetical protein VND68_10055 [Chloroflexia bacterium]|nr:hypothetical protein [Chloroflexia bacterium]
MALTLYLMWLQQYAVRPTDGVSACAIMLMKLWPLHLELHRAGQSEQQAIMSKPTIYNVQQRNQTQTVRSG